MWACGEIGEQCACHLEETVSGGVVEPRVIVRAPDARLQVDRLPGNLFASQLARVRHPTGGRPFDHALFPPWFEVLHLVDDPRLLDPLDHLRHGHEVHVVVVGQHLVDPEQERVQVLGVVLQPGGVEVQAHGRAVLVVMPVEVVVQEVVELVAGQDVGARVHHGTAGQVLVEARVLPPVQFVHHHLPDGVTTGRTVLQVSMTPVALTISDVRDVIIIIDNVVTIVRNEKQEFYTTGRSAGSGTESIGESLKCRAANKVL